MSLRRSYVLDMTTCFCVGGGLLVVLSGPRTERRVRRFTSQHPLRSYGAVTDARGWPRENKSQPAAPSKAPVLHGMRCSPYKRRRRDRPASRETRKGGVADRRPPANVPVKVECTSASRIAVRP